MTAPDPGSHRESLAIAVAQPRSVAYDVAANATTHAAIVRAAGARIVVFPELSLTGYELDAPVVSPHDPALTPLIDACADTGSIALAGAPTAAARNRSNAPHIAVLAIDGTGARVAYEKMFLGATEAERFSPGEAPSVIGVDGWRIGLAICKDTGITEHADITCALGADLYVAGVCESADDAGIQPARARRIIEDHGIWVAIASFAGPTGGGYERTAGGSAIWAPPGIPVAMAGTGVDEYVTAVIQPPANPSRRGPQ